MKSLFASLFVILGANAQASTPAMKPFIIGGTPVQSDSVIAHSTVALYMVSESALCTGSIISPNWIVTAAHCVTDENGQAASPDDVSVFYGLDVMHPTTLSPNVQKVIVYPGYVTQSNDPTDEGDIALVQIEGNLPGGFTPIPILKNRSDLKAGETVTLAGHGITDASSQSGAGLLREVSGIKILNPMLGTTEVVLDQSEGRGACHGDSGGPGYLVDSSGNYYLWGVTDRGYPDNAPDDCMHQAVYTNVLAYLDWIKQSVPGI